MMPALAVTAASPSFLFATCNPGWESALKAEMRTRHGETITPAFLRPGLVTWKVREETAPSLVGSLTVLAHVSGYSLGMAKTLEELPEIAGRCGTMPDRIHVFPRVLPENGFTAEEWDAIDVRADEILSFLRESGLNSDSSPPRQGDLVLDMILGQEDEALFVGWHRHDRFRFPFPGGMPRAILPDDAPSRAWLKMEQGLHYAGLGDSGSLAGKTALELGCAPGGGRFSLLTHGAKVLGVDTGEMDGRVLAFDDGKGAAFSHFAISAGELRIEDLPRRVDLLASDMNLAPPVALRYIERLQRRVRARTLLLTLKINDAKMQSQIPTFLERVRKLTPGEVIATQLPSNRKEITILSLPERR
jgi:23S rRNA (cytidine2498-2'-O)-methyltransferase